MSWLRRLSVRYDVPARDLLRTAGAKRPITATSRVTGRLRNYRGIAQRLGLTAEEVSQLVNPAPLLAATAAYLDTFRPAGSQIRPGSRYCPRCLGEREPFWPEHWQSPLSLICLVHGSYLVHACPRCGQPPLASTAWLGRPTDLHRCPARLNLPYATRAGGQRQMWCGQDLTQLKPVAAPAEQVEAQQLLHNWSSGSADHATACGVAITHRIGFQALVELADATLGAGIDLLDLATDPAQVAAGIPAAVRVLHQTSLAAAADAAAGLLAADGPHAPIGPTGRILAHHYSPLLAAVQLHSVRHQLTTDQQLMFRTGHPLPRYPAITTRDNRRRLRLPAHRPHWPEPDPAWIPQTLWWNAVPTPLARHASSALVRSMLAMGLAKTGSTRDWTTIADNLDLPATHVTRIARLTRYLQRNGDAWLEILAALERLMTGLQQHPPPIDYPARRDTAHNLALFTAAVEHGRRRHPSAAPVETLTRQFWERFTGGDIAYAPTPIRIGPKSPAYRAFRRQHGIKETDLFHLAHQHLCRTTNTEGPLTWHPGLLPDPTDGDEAAAGQM